MRPLLLHRQVTIGQPVFGLINWLINSFYGLHTGQAV